MKFTIIGHLINDQNPDQIPEGWTLNEDLMITPELNFNGTKGCGISILLSPKQMMQMPQEDIRQQILNACMYAQNHLDAEVIQLGGLTTSVTSGGVWLTEQEEFQGFVNHGDSYTAAVTCQTVMKALEQSRKQSSDMVLAVVGAYGVIGEAVSKILVPKFKHSILIGRRSEKLEELSSNLDGDFHTTRDLETKDADVIVTATSHPTALLNSSHFKENAIVVDVSQPPNLSYDVCIQRPDILRVDGGFVDSPTGFNVPLMPPGKIFACIAEVIMQAMENEKKNHVGSIDLSHLHKTEELARKHGFELNDLTNFGKTIKT
ncbi:MAG: hypothetical protein DRN27_07165 [Thermoplasmata archaeon]|nr:MAG: hypothetical protein DRN27_07165 [Thermoplasmata archaeon]